jgi:hypothetical protein
MFNLFKKKIGKLEVVDICFISDDAKLTALVNLAKQDGTCIFLCWFSETKILLEEKFASEAISPNRVQFAERQIISQFTNERKVMVEHHPNLNKEKQFFEKLNDKRIQVYNSLNEAIFLSGNVASIIDLLRKMGISDDNPIEHSMITASIKKVQEKFENVTSDFINANSQGEWIRKNSSNA